MGLCASAEAEAPPDYGAMLRDGREVVNLNGKRLGPEEGRAIGEALKGNTTLRELDLDYNRLGPDGARHIAEGLKGNTTLRLLDLRRNGLGDDGVRHIAEALKGNTALRDLILTTNSLGDDGARHIAEALKGSTTLRRLYLHRNRLGPDGARHIAEALKSNTTLRTLWLYDNSLGPDGARHIAEALESNFTLCTLDGVKLPDRSAIDRNNRLAKLHADDAAGPLSADEAALLAAVTSAPHKAALLAACVSAGRGLPSDLLREAAAASIETFEREVAAMQDTAAEHVARVEELEREIQRCTAAGDYEGAGQAQLQQLEMRGRLEHGRTAVHRLAKEVPLLVDGVKQSVELFEAAKRESESNRKFDEAAAAVRETVALRKHLDALSAMMEVVGRVGAVLGVDKPSEKAAAPQTRAVHEDRHATAAAPPPSAATEPSRHDESVASAPSVSDVFSTAATAAGSNTASVASDLLGAGAALPVFGLVFELLAGIARLAEASMANRANCAALAARCASLEPVIREVADAARQASQPPRRVVRAAEAVRMALEDASALLEQFSDSSRLRRFFSSGRFRARFHERDEALTRAVADLAATAHVEVSREVRAVAAYADASVAQVREELAAELQKRDAARGELKALAEENRSELEALRAQLGRLRAYLTAQAETRQLKPDRHGHTTLARPARLAEGASLELDEDEARRAEGFAVLDRKIGYGGFGTVYRGELRGVPVAVKVARATRRTSTQREWAEHVAAVRAEAEAMARLDSPHVVRLVGVHTGGDALLLVTELVAGGSLADALRDGGDVLPLETRVRLARQVAAALAHMHSRRPAVLHRDVKAANVLLTGDERMSARLCDLGLARLASAGVAESTLAAAAADTMHPGAGTPQYMAPEVFRGEAPTPAVDVFSFGVLLVALFGGATPGAGRSREELADDVRRGGAAGREVVPAEAAARMPAPLAALARRCTATRPEERPRMAAVRLELAQLEDAGVM